MAFKNLFGEVGLALPYGRKVYVVEPVDAELGPQVQALVDVMIKVEMGSPDAVSGEDAELLSDLGEQEMYPRLLGDAYAEMVADNVPWAVIKRAAVATMFDACLSREAAEAAWNGEGKAPNREARRAAKAVASRTRSPASTAGTSKPRPPRKATASRGRRSSTSGTS